MSRYLILFLLALGGSFAIRYLLGPYTYYAGTTGAALILVGYLVAWARRGEYAPMWLAAPAAIGASLMLALVWPAVWIWAIHQSIKHPLAVKAVP